jgi:molybdenum cofactor biosynthesis protein B
VLPGFGELFRALSFPAIGAAAMLSRALAGVVGGRAVFALPGSPKAVELAMARLVLPEVGHLLAQARRPAARPREGGDRGVR